MKQLLLILLFAAAIQSNGLGQYYVRGQVKDEKGRPLVGALIKLHTKGNLQFFSGDNGLFGIPSSKPIDTITITFDGFETFREAIETQKYQNLTLKMLAATASLMKNKLASITKNLSPNQQINFLSTIGESYTSFIENEFVAAKNYPETGFALNIDRASYSNIRRFLNNELTVPSNAVRIEEMLNYFNLSLDKVPNTSQQFTCNNAVTTCPWQPNNHLVFINLNAPKLNLDSVPPSNLVFLIDVSGSMDKPNRLPLLQAGFKLLAKNLRPIDKLSIVTYGSNIAVALPPTNGNELDKINEVIDSLTASGDSPGEGAIRTAYAIAKSAYIPNGNNRIILATDGDFNVGQTSDKDLEDMITIQRQSGIYLTCLGVGMGNYKDSKLETLAKKGNGNFAYLDNAAEAEKVLVTEFTKTIYTVANDAYVNVAFNEAKIKRYRLIGFDNKKEAIADASSKVEGGEVGSGHNLIAIFEVEPIDTNTISGENLATIALQYKLSSTGKSQSQSFPVVFNNQKIEDAPPTIRFATAVSMFGALLKNSIFSKNYTFTDVLALASAAADKSNIAQQEFINLVQKAERIYQPTKKKKKVN
jgi:Ca-activated chloride channel family protein